MTSGVIGNAPVLMPQATATVETRPRPRVVRPPRRPKSMVAITARATKNTRPLPPNPVDRRESRPKMKAMVSSVAARRVNGIRSRTKVIIRIAA